MKKSDPIARIDITGFHDDPNKIKELNYPEIAILCRDLRQAILSACSTYGGHLSSNLGVVELTVALFRVFDFPKDKLILDVGHQSYAYKLLSGRSLEGLNTPGHTSGFQKRSEGPYDCYEAGHSSTAISAAEAFAYARDKKNEKYQVIALVGDGAMGNGLSFEGLNDLSFRDHKVIIILNDNDMSISKPVGGIGRLFRHISTGRLYNRMKRDYRNIMLRSGFGRTVYSWTYSFKNSIKRRFIPLTLFDNLGFTYMGPFDGHNVKLLEKNLRRAMVTNKSVVFHVKTIKGKGYAPAEDDKTGYWHGASPFDIKTGLPKNTHPGLITYSHLFADLTLQEMGKHEDSVLIVPAMMKGSQQDKAFEAYKDRCFDVGIQEEHALTFAGALALNGYHPIVDIYSTFLQRAYDELLHDCARLNIKMTLLIDRAGFVGKDGETHHGIFDPAYLSSIPGITLSMPSTREIAAGLYDLSFKQNGILGIRYSREALLPDEGDINPKELNIGDFDLISKAEDEQAICLCVGPMGREFAKSVNEYRKPVTCIDPIFISPLSDSLLDVLLQAKRIFVYDPYSTYEGFCSQVSLSLARNGYGGKLKLVSIPKGFYQSDTIANQMKTAGVDVESAMFRLDELLED